MLTGAVQLSWRENLARFAHSRDMAVLFGAILPLALLLRLLSLGGASLSEDEIFSVLLARQHLADFWNVITHSEANMALYYTFLRFWIHLGQSEFTIRSLSVIFALAAVAALYSLGTIAFGRKVGSLGALLLAINGFHIEYSQDARSYSLLVFLVTFSSLFFLRSVHEGSWRNWICYIVASTLAIYAHIFAVFVLLAHWVFLLFVPRRVAPWRRLAQSTAAIAFLATPMGLFVLFRTEDISFVPKTTVRSVGSLFAHLAGTPEDIPGYSTALLLFIYSILVVIAILALLKARSRWMNHTERWHLAFLLTWLWVPILLVLVISIRKPLFYDRFLIICLPPFLLLASYGCSRLHRVWLVVALLWIIAGLTARGLLIYYRSPGQDWRGVAQYVLSEENPGDAAVFCPDYFGSRLSYYLQREPITGPRLTLLVPASHKSIGTLLPDPPSHYGRIWFIRRDEPIQAEVALQVRRMEATLATEFPRISKEKRFPGNLVVVLYSK